MNIWPWDPQNVNIFNEYFYLMYLNVLEEETKELILNPYLNYYDFLKPIVHDSIPQYSVTSEEVFTDKFEDFLKIFTKPIEDMKVVKKRSTKLVDFLKESLQMIKELQEDMEEMDKK